MVLADSFSPAKRKEYIQRQLKPWRILYLHCQFTHPPKPKYILLIDVNSDLKFFVIGSRVAKLIRAQSKMKCTQVAIEAASHPCLSHDSIVDCSRVWAIAGEDAERQLMADVNRIKGLASEPLRLLIIEAVKKNPRMTGHEKRAVLRYLTASG